MSRGISNAEIERVFKDINNAYLNESFIGLFPLTVMFEKVIPGKKYSFMNSNTGREDRPCTHWWKILNISLTSETLFFDSFGIAGLKNSW